MSWRDNTTVIHKGRWEKTRRAVFDRDGWRCTRCGQAGRLEAHHVSADSWRDPYDVAGIVTLCRACHIEHHRTENFSPDQIAWRKFVDAMAGGRV